MLSFFRTLLLFAILCVAQAVDYCAPLGPVYELPRNLFAETSIRLAAQNLTTRLNQAFGSSNASSPVFAPNTTAFSVDLFSADEEGSLFRYHFTPSALNASSTRKVDEDTVYRIGSISKLVTVLGVLLQADKVHWDDPITKYIPELAQDAGRENYDKEEDETDDDLTTPQWSQITVGALASQLSGIGRAYSFGELSSEEDLLMSRLGFPALNDSDVPRCGSNPSQPPCSRQEFLQGLKKRRPIYAPFTTPVYSNAAYDLLGYVIEKVTNQSYDVAIQNTIFGPLGLSHSSVSPPRDASVGVIPIGEITWDWDLGAQSPGGGIYMSTRDLSNLGRAILKSRLLKPAQTRQWLRRQTHTASLPASVGAPWEIYRVPGVTQDGRVIELYTKSGAIGLYTSSLVLIPDYNIGLTLLVAGPSSPLLLLMEEALGTFIPAIEQVGKKQAAARYTGVYDDPSSGLSNSSTALVEISVDQGPGLVVSRWISNNTDVLKGGQDLLGLTSGYIDMRLYPTGLKNEVGRQKTVSYRAVSQLRPSNDTAGESTTDQTSISKAFADACPTWSGLDLSVYGLIGVDDFVFRTDSLGDVKSIEPRVTRKALQKRVSAIRVRNWCGI